MASASLDLSGMFPPMATPFLGPNGDEGVDFDAIEKNIRERYNPVQGLSGFIVQGSNGEYVMLSGEERVEVVRRVAQAAKEAGKLVVAGCGCEGTHHSIELGRQMLDAGADALLVITPSYFKASLNDRTLKKHFSTIAKALHTSHGARGRIILYNMAANTGVDMSASLVTDIVRENWEGPGAMRNIIGLKDSGGNVQKMAIIRESTKQYDSVQPFGFQLLAGSYGFLLPALSVGAVGGVCAFANAFPEEACQLMKLWKEACENGSPAKLREATTLQTKWTEINFALTAKLGVPAMKTAMMWRGFAGQNHVRLPLMPMTEAEEASLKSSFQKVGAEIRATL